MRNVPTLACLTLLVACADDDVLSPRRVAPAPIPSVGGMTMSMASATLDVIPLVASDPTYPFVDAQGLGVNASGIVVGWEAGQLARVLRYPPADTIQNPGGFNLQSGRAIATNGDVVGMGYEVSGRGFHMNAAGLVTWLQSFPNPIAGTASTSEALDISDHGEIVGWSIGPSDNYVHGVVWTTPTAAPVELPSLFPSPGIGVPNGMAPGLSGSQRLVAGHSNSLPGGPSIIKPTAWVGTTPVELPGLPGLSNAGGQAYAAADNGMIVGYVPMASGQSNPVVWKDGALHTDLANQCEALTGYRFGSAMDIAITPTGRVLIAGWCGAYEPVVFASHSDGSFSGEVLSCGTSFGCALLAISSTGYITGWVNTSSGNRAARWHYTPPAVNQPPTVLIGDFMNNEGNVGLYGITATDPENDNLLATWDFGDGSPPDTGITLFHTYADNGAYNVTVRVSDGHSTVTVTSTASIANVEPLATLVAPTTAITTGSTFSLSLINPSDPSPVDSAVGFTYAFDCGNGFSTPSATPNITCTAGAPGTITVWGRITDKEGGSANIWANVTITATPNQPPTLSIGGPYTALEGSTLTLFATSSDPDNDPLTLAWYFGDGATGTGPSPTHVWADNGTYNVMAVLSDGQLSDTAFATVTIVNATPTGGLVAPTAPLPQDTPFALGIANPTDPSPIDVTSLTFRFNCGAGWSAWGVAPTTACTARGTPGNYPVSAAVRDKDGAITSYSRQVTVTNQSPVVTPSTTGPITIARGAPLTVSASFTDRAGDAPWSARVTWGKGQGNTSVGSVTTGVPFSATNSYSKVGTYTVTFEVRDTHNALGTASLTVIVR